MSDVQTSIIVEIDGRTYVSEHKTVEATLKGIDAQFNGGSDIWIDRRANIWDRAGQCTTYNGNVYTVRLVPKKKWQTDSGWSKSRLGQTRWSEI